MKGFNKKIVITAIISSVIVALMLIAGTFWTGKTASEDTEKAVQNVSQLYLEELADRREQVLSSTLNDYISDLDIALGLLTEDDFSSVEKLRAYQLRMKQFYGLEKFAFVNENGLIYTSRGTRTDIDQYSFDYKNISSPEISIKTSGGITKVIIAVPTDRLPFEGNFLVVCFMEIDMDYMLKNISLQSGSNNTTFCNVYTSEGYSLTDMVLGGLASEDNLLSALENAEFDEEYNLEKMRENFSKSQRGVASFTYNDVKETMFYVPVHRTNWMLTYLIRESVISTQIDTISEGILKRSFTMSVLTALILSAIFIFMVFQTRKASKLAHERETSEMMQQELEERIFLQDELLEQEKKRAQQDNMITALAADYKSVYYVNLDTDQATCIRNDYSDKNFAPNDVFGFTGTFTKYANENISEEYREQFLEFIKPENIRAELKKKSDNYLPLSREKK